MIAPTIGRQSGYFIDRVYVLRQSHEILQDRAALPDGEPSVLFGWDWHIDEEEPAFFHVAVTLGIEGSKERPENAEVWLVGRFQLGEKGAPHSIDFDHFVRTNAPAILFPYARSVLANLTLQGLLGVYHFPPMNVIRLMEDQDPAAATGAQQLLRDPALAERYGHSAGETGG
ncbi:MAG: protein-export chaperone SecB [Gemmatimonadaceae bacterium]